MRTLTNKQFWTLWDNNFFKADAKQIAKQVSACMYRYTDDDEWQLEITVTSRRYSQVLYQAGRPHLSIERTCTTAHLNWPASEFVFVFTVDDSFIDRVTLRGVLAPERRWIPEDTLQRISSVLPDFLLRKAKK